MSKTSTFAVCAVALFAIVAPRSLLDVDVGHEVTAASDDSPSPGPAASSRDDDHEAARGASGASDRLAVRRMSQTFRHSTFLIAIRNAGLFCDDVVAARESADGVWLASCSDIRGYKISVAAQDRLEVEPALHYVDAAF